VNDLAISLPAAVAGSAVGLGLFQRLNDKAFRKAMMLVLLVSGLALAD